MAEWISVKDRVPEDAQFIVYCINNPILSATGRYCAQEENPMPSSPFGMDWKRVTHWMSLPEPPDTPLSEEIK